MKDTVELRGIRVLAHCGVTLEERDVRQTIEIDLDLEADQYQAGQSDDLCDAIDYEPLCNAIEEIAETRSFALIEKMAQTIVDEILEQDERIDAVTITLRKIVPPVHVEIATAAVKIRRSRS